MATVNRRPFSAWVADVFCGLVAFVGARAARLGMGQGLWDSLPQDLAVFVGVYVAMRLLLRLLAARRVRSAQHAEARRAAALIAKQTQEQQAKRP
jgi:hypothetical protein